MWPRTTRTSPAQHPHLLSHQSACMLGIGHLSWEGGLYGLQNIEPALFYKKSNYWPPTKVNNLSATWTSSRSRATQIQMHTEKSCVVFVFCIHICFVFVIVFVLHWLTKVEEIYLQVCEHNSKCTQKRAGEAKKWHLPWPTNSLQFTLGVLNSRVFRLFCLSPRMTEGWPENSNFSTRATHSPQCCPGSGSNVHRCPNKKGESKYLRYLMLESGIW